MFPFSFLLNKYVLGLGAIAIVIAGLYYYGYSRATTKYEAAQAQITADEKLQKVLIEQRDAVHVQTEVQQQQVIKTVIQKVVQNVQTIVDRPVYHNVCLDDDGLRYANEALTAGTATSGTATKVPAPNPAP